MPALALCGRFGAFSADHGLAGVSKRSHRRGRQRADRAGDLEALENQSLPIPAESELVAGDLEVGGPPDVALDERAGGRARRVEVDPPGAELEGTCAAGRADGLSRESYREGIEDRDETPIRLGGRALRCPEEDLRDRRRTGLSRSGSGDGQLRRHRGGRVEGGNRNRLPSHADREDLQAPGVVLEEEGEGLDRLDQGRLNGEQTGAAGNGDEPRTGAGIDPLHRAGL
ncbi:MAG: hypothetical protein ACO4CW_15065, partial [Planctomycetota bacterium]